MSPEGSRRAHRPSSRTPSSAPASSHSDEIAWIKRDNLVEVATWLRDDPAMAFDSPVFVHRDRLARLEPDRRAARRERGTRASRGSRSRTSCARSSIATASGSRSTARERRALPVARRAVAGVQLAGARDVRHVRDPVRRSPRPAPHLPVRGVRRLPAAQGLPEGEAPAARAARRPPDQPDQGRSTKQ